MKYRDYIVSFIVSLLLKYVPILVDILFKFLKKKYGGSLMGLVMDNIGSLEELKRAGDITGEDAERTSVQVIMDATQMSPGLGTSIAKFINLIAYMKFVGIHYPEKFRNWVANMSDWTDSGKKIRYKNDFERMGLYINRPDRK